MDLYSSFVDKQARDELGITPLRPYLASIDACQTPQDVGTAFAHFQRIAVPPPLAFVVQADPKDSSRAALKVSQFGLGQTKAVLDGEDEGSAGQRGLYRDHLARLFELAEFSKPVERADRVIALERRISAVTWSPAELRDPNKAYNPMSRQEFDGLLSNFAMERVAAAIGFDDRVQTLIVLQPSQLEGLNRLLVEADLESWRDYLRARLLTHYVDYLSAPFHQTAADYKTKQGIVAKEPSPAILNISFLDDNVDMLLGRFYVDHFVEKGSKARVESIIQGIRKEFELAISNSTTFSEATRQRALEKLAHMTYQVSYPDEWQDYSAFEARPDDLAGNLARLAEYDHLRMMDRLNRPVNRNEWLGAPYEVNTFYQPSGNRFLLLAGILQQPFYDDSWSDAAIYGGLGYVIAHEIGHGFDDQGSQYDSVGNLSNWWTEEDRQKFGAIKQRMLEQANNFTVNGHHLNGALELGEILGDLNGAQIALRAALRAAEAQGVDREQATRDFFMGAGRSWRSKYREALVLKLLQTDGHPPGQFRVNGIFRNLDAFHETFGTQPGDGMYLAREERVQIW